MTIFIFYLNLKKVKNKEPTKIPKTNGGLNEQNEENIQCLTV